MNTRSKKNTNSSVESNTENRMEKINLNIPTFKGAGSITIENFLKIFERRTEDRKDEHVEIIFNHLEKATLDYAILQDLHLDSWVEAKTKLKNYFTLQKNGFHAGLSPNKVGRCTRYRRVLSDYGRCGSGLRRSGEDAY